MPPTSYQMQGLELFNKPAEPASSPLPTPQPESKSLPPTDQLFVIQPDPEPVVFSSEQPKKEVAFTPFGKDLFGETVTVKTSPLTRRFIVPPFSVLDAAQGYWQDRKRAWMDWGIRSELGRDDSYVNSETENIFVNKKGTCGALSPGTSPEIAERFAKCGTGTSIFDPVLTELIYSWFNVPGGSILDPFGGGSTRGIVAHAMGHKYTGLDIRKEQIDANTKQAGILGLAPNWICGDSAKISTYLPVGEKYDMVFSCPPYYNLEEYQGGEKDGSSFGTYQEFMSWYGLVFGQCIKHLKNNRFLVVVVGEIRDTSSSGEYHNFVGDNISCFLSMSMLYYNEIILVTPVGSLPVRSGRQFASGRKVGKRHQNVLVFYKGDIGRIKEEFPQAEDFI